LATERPLEEVEQQRRGRIERRLRHARKMVTEKTNEVRRAAAAIGRWSKRVAYYEKELAITVAEKRALREQQLAKRRKRRATRKIAL
jgi:hypothetical protein